MQPQNEVAIIVPLEPKRKARGSLLMLEKEKTIFPITREIRKMKINGVYNENHQKLWLSLVFNAFNKLGKENLFYIPASDLARTLRQCGGARNGSYWLVDLAEQLGKVSVRWHDEEGEGVTFMISEFKESEGWISYGFSNALREFLLNNEGYSSLRMRFVLGLTGKYTIPLYAYLEGISGRRIPTEAITLDELREILNVPPGKLSNWKDFKKFALQPAIDKIQAGEAESGLQVSYEPIRNGKTIVALRFTANRTLARLNEEKSNKIRIEQTEFSKVEIRPFSDNEYDMIERAIGNNFAANGKSKREIVIDLEKIWRGEELPKFKKAPDIPIAAFIAYIKEITGKKKNPENKSKKSTAEGNNKVKQKNPASSWPFSNRNLTPDEEDIFRDFCLNKLGLREDIQGLKHSFYSSLEPLGIVLENPLEALRNYVKKTHSTSTPSFNEKPAGDKKPTENEKPIERLSAEEADKHFKKLRASLGIKK